MDLTPATPAPHWWINGVEQAATTINGDAPFVQGLSTSFGAPVVHTFGTRFDGTSPWTGSLADTYLVLGHAADASAFVSMDGVQLHSIEYTGPFDAESVHFDYVVPGHNLFAGQADWTVNGVTSATDGLPY